MANDASAATAAGSDAVQPGDGAEPSSAVRPSPGRVAVRLARTEADIAAMIALGRELHVESRFRTLALDEDRMLAIGRRGLENGNPALMVAERNGEIVGMATVILGDYFFSPVRTATVQLLYVLPKARGGLAAVKLLRAIRRWAEQNGARDIHVNVTTGIDAARTDRFLRKMGFRQTGGNYVLEGVG
jgi:Sortase and related acyltransferases